MRNLASFSKFRLETGIGGMFYSIRCSLKSGGVQQLCLAPGFASSCGGSACMAMSIEEKLLSLGRT